MERALPELLRTPPADFVATRNRIVAELKAAGDADRARELAALRRPALVDWALNVTAAEHPASIAEWATAAEAAQLAVGADLRAALADLRAATTAVVRVVGRRAPAGDVAQALTRVAADADLIGALRAGRLGFAIDGEFATATEKVAPSGPRTIPTDLARQAAQEAAARALAEAKAAESAAEADLDAAAEGVAAAREALVDAERVHVAAQRRLTAARRLVADAK